MSTKKQEEKTIELVKPAIKYARIGIKGTTDLVLNKINDINARQLIDERKDKAKKLEAPNEWEMIITAMHWYDHKPTDFTEDGLKKAMEDKSNPPCITAFGLKASFGDAVVRNGVDTYSTKFKAAMNIKAKGGLLPITFAEHYIDEKLMSPKKGHPVLVHLNRFVGWGAEFDIEYMESVYSLEQIINIISLAGFGIGIGSGRSSDYGRYEVLSVADMGSNE